MEKVANCACGNLAVKCVGDPAKVSVCHCFGCQRRTGSTYGIAAFYSRSAVTITGKRRTFTRASDNGASVEHHFCPDCGSTVFWYPARMPELVAIGVGSFADPDFPAPSQAVFSHNRHSWVAEIEGRNL